MIHWARSENECVVPTLETCCAASVSHRLGLVQHDKILQTNKSVAHIMPYPRYPIKLPCG